MSATAKPQATPEVLNYASAGATRRTERSREATEKAFDALAAEIRQAEAEGR
jgi:hypothetical protein